MKREKLSVSFLDSKPILTPATIAYTGQGHSRKVFNIPKVRPKFSTGILYMIKFFSAVTIVMVAGILLSMLGRKDRCSNYAYDANFFSPLLINSYVILAKD